jgi:hypothetical protein
MPCAIRRPASCHAAAETPFAIPLIPSSAPTASAGENASNLEPDATAARADVKAQYAGGYR